MIQPASKGPFKALEWNLYDHQGNVVAEFGRSGDSCDDCHANARYFAHAANVHERMVEALQGVIDFIAPCKDRGCSCPICTARAALDAARGER